MSDWLRQLAALVLLAGVAEVLLPQGSFRGYARSVLGLMVVVAVLQPLLRFLGPEADWWHLAAAAAPAVAEEGRATRDLYRSALEEQVAGVAAAVPGVAQARARVTLGEGLPPVVTAVEVDVQPRAVAPVRVGARGAGTGRSGQAELAARVADAVAAVLNLPRGAITVRVGGWS
jgi:stage III sporulation protein AF